MTPFTVTRRGSFLSLALLTGALLALTGNRWGVPLFAWLAPAGVWLLARRASGWREGALLGLVVLVGTFLQVLKLVTPPVSWLLAVPFSLPASVGTLLGAWLYRQAVRRAGEAWAVGVAGALAALGDWMTARHSDLGTWGTAANTQLGNLPLLQLVSLAGVPGVALVMGLCGAALVLLLDAPRWREHRGLLLSVAALVVAVEVWGAWRAETVQTGPTVLVAAVTTDLGLEGGQLPSAERRAQNEAELVARTRLAAARGARLVAWNEAAAMLESADEPAFLARGQALARELGVDLVLGYAARLPGDALGYDNRAAFIGSDGAVLEVYAKHHPVPGEPSVRGEAPLGALVRPWGVTATAICYDYDFPELALAHARLGAGLVVVPSSDWLGIDPQHGQVTRVRALEGGFSVLRPVRWATTQAFDAYGRARGALSAWEETDHVLLAALPVTPVPTLYARLGDGPTVTLSLLLLAGAALAGVMRRRTARLRGEGLPGTVSPVPAAGLRR